MFTFFTYFCFWLPAIYDWILFVIVFASVSFSLLVRKLNDTLASVLSWNDRETITETNSISGIQ